MPSCPQETYVSGTYDGSVVSPYFDIATKYGFANYFFQTNQGPSMPAHLFLFSGTSSPTGLQPQKGALNFFQAENPPGGVNNDDDDTACTAPAGQTVALIDQSGLEIHDKNNPLYPEYNIFPCFSHNTLPTLLDAASPSVTWKYYTNQPKPTSTNNIWNAPAAIQEICYPLTPPNLPNGAQCGGYDYVNDVVVNNIAQILLDLGTVSKDGCALRNVSWVVPNGDRSDHPGFAKGQNNSTQIEGGPGWVADIINAVGQGPCTDTVNSQAVPYWQDTAIFVVWDDWGGFWDHISPYEVLIQDPAINKFCDPTLTFGCGYISGFRVPFLVVSAYTGTYNQNNGTYSGYVSGACGQSPLPPCPNEAFPYKHDFGSILAFIENNFLGSTAIGSINAQNNYKFADAFAPDYRAQPLNIPLADFFPLSTPRPFQAIALPPGAPHANYFINYNGPILDPDNDGIDND